jgi:lactoylglutathione lyase
VEAAALSPTKETRMNFTKLTPNLIVGDVAASLHFYQSVLGFEQGVTVPDSAPYVFGSVTNGSVEIFFNDQKMVAEEDPELAGTNPAAKVGGTLTLYLETDAIEEVFCAVEKAKCRITMPLKTQFYGMREFAFQDPDGWTITVAQKVSSS